MRIAVVCPYDLTAPGGVQQVCRQLVDRLNAAGEEAELIGPGDTLPGRVRRFTANRSTVPLTLSPTGVRWLRKTLAGFDVVHVHEPFVPVAGWTALTARHTPRVATFHADPARWSRLLYRLGSPLGRAVMAGVEMTAVSRVARSALPASWGEVTLVPNAVDVAAYRVEVDRNPRQVAFLGRDDPRKGLDVLLAAWPQIRRKVDDARLVVVGATRPSGGDGISFLGRVDEKEKRRTLASSAIQVAPNTGGESFGVVVAEGMAAGCAVVASDIPAFADVLGDAGMLVAPGDVDGLAKAIALLLNEPRRVERLGEAARQAVARFDWSTVVDRYRAVYESALRRGPGTIRGRKE